MRKVSLQNVWSTWNLGCVETRGHHGYPVLFSTGIWHDGSAMWFILNLDYNVWPQGYRGWRGCCCTIAVWALLPWCFATWLRACFWNTEEVWVRIVVLLAVEHPVHCAILDITYMFVRTFYVDRKHGTHMNRHKCTVRGCHKMKRLECYLLHGCHIVESLTDKLVWYIHFTTTASSKRASAY